LSGPTRDSPAALRAKAEGRDEESDEVLRPEALDQQRIEDLVASNLQASRRLPLAPS